MSVALIKLPVYSSIPGHFAIYWIMKCGQGSGPLILAWINEICADDSEKRAILVAAGNDFAYIMQAIVSGDRKACTRVEADGSCQTLCGRRSTSQRPRKE